MVWFWVYNIDYLHKYHIIEVILKLLHITVYMKSDHGLTDHSQELSILRSTVKKYCIAY